MIQITEGDGWRLGLGDCFGGLRSLADKSVDVTIMDPPYSDHVDTGQAVSGRRTGQAVVKHKKIGRVGSMDSEKIVLACTEVVRVTQRWVVSFCAWEQGHEYAAAINAAGGRYLRTCAWLKPDATPQLSGDRPATWGECMIVGFASPELPLTWNGGGKRGVYTYGVTRGAERSEHPTQKPLALMRELVDDFATLDGVVLDPFAGSGTTLIAARMSGRRALSFEIDSEYHGIAVRRLRGEASVVNPKQVDWLLTP